MGWFDEIKMLWAKTPPPPWRYQEVSDKYTNIVRCCGTRFLAQFGQHTGGREEALARLFAEIPSLITEVERTRKIEDAARRLMCALETVGLDEPASFEALDFLNDTIKANPRPGGGR